MIVSDDLRRQGVSATCQSCIFHTHDYAASGCTGTDCIVKVVNIMGFFVEGMCDDVAAQGRLDPTTYCDEPQQDRRGPAGCQAAQYQGGPGEQLAWRGVPTDLQPGQVVGD